MTKELVQRFATPCIETFVYHDTVNEWYECQLVVDGVKQDKEIITTMRGNAHYEAKKMLEAALESYTSP